MWYLDTTLFFGAEGGLPCNPGGVIAVHAHSCALPHWSGLHCAHHVHHRAVAMCLPKEELSPWWTGGRRVDRPSLQRERRPLPSAPSSLLSFSSVAP